MTAVTEQPAGGDSATNQADMPIRHLDFQFDGVNVDTRFYRHSELATAYFHALSIFLTFGEDLVIDTARHHRPYLSDPELKRRVTALIGQEAVHSKVHDEFNETLVDYRYPLNLYRFLADKVFRYGFYQLPHRMQLSMMAGIEHYTAVIAEFMMDREEVFDATDDEKQRALWMWHMLEESEHKDIAYDVYQALSGDYALRVSGFAVASVTIIFLVALGGAMIPPIRRPRKLLSRRYWKDVVRGVGLLYGPREGVYGSTMGHILDYLRPDFHPNDHDVSVNLAYYENKLLDPEDGLLTRYLTREFYPKLRTA